MGATAVEPNLTATGTPALSAEEAAALLPASEPVQREEVRPGRSYQVTHGVLLADWQRDAAKLRTSIADHVAFLNDEEYADHPNRSAAVAQLAQYREWLARKESDISALQTTMNVRAIRRNADASRRRATPQAQTRPRGARRSGGRPRAQSTRSSAKSGDSPEGEQGDSDPPALPWRSDRCPSCLEWRMWRGGELVCINGACSEFGL